MAKLICVLPEELEQKFREKVFTQFGMKKGNISIALQEAITDWIAKKELEKKVW